MPESIERIEKLLNTSIDFHELDLLDKSGLEKLFKKVRVTRTYFITAFKRTYMETALSDDVSGGKPRPIS